MVGAGAVGGPNDAAPCGSGSASATLAIMAFERGELHSPIPVQVTRYRYM
jgi:hypothetical protein